MEGKETRDTRKYSRRTMLKAAGGAGIGIVLAACGGNTGTGGGQTPTTSTGGATGGMTPTTSTGTSAMTPAGGATMGTGGTTPAGGATMGTGSGTAPAGGPVSPNATVNPSGLIKTSDIMKSGVKIPSSDIKFRWMDSDDLKANFESPYFKIYEKAHPNVHIEYDGFAWAQINEIVPLGVRNGTAPDVFAKPQPVPAQEMINSGWVSTIPELIPNFDEWKKNFSFVPGVHVYNDKIYTWPASSSKRMGGMLMYSTEYMEPTGYDPMSKPITWDEFRDAAKKITKAGKGQYYGYMISGKAPDALGGFVTELAELAGASGGDYNWKTGKYNYTSDQFKAAIDLLMALKSDGSIFPGFMSLSSADARARMPQGVAGMIFDGPWDILKWPQQNPKFKFGVASPPIPNDRKPAYHAYSENGANESYVFAKGKNKEVAGDLYHYMGTLEGQTAMVILSQGNLSSEIEEANQKAQRSKLLNPLALKGVQLADQYMRRQPIPQVRNPDVVQVILEEKAVHPNLTEILQGYVTGQVKDIDKELQDLTDRTQKNRDDAIKAAKAKGAQVSNDDWVFPNWDPSKDYTKADYEALKK